MQGAPRLLYLDPLGWMVSGVWVWGIPAILGAWVLGRQGPIGPALGILQAMIGFAAALLLRAIGATVYNISLGWHGGIRVTYEDFCVTRIPVLGATKGLAALAMPWGLGMSLVVNGFGWIAVIPHHWVWCTVGLPLVAWLYAMTSVWLYSHVVPWFSRSCHVSVTNHGHLTRVKGFVPTEMAWMSAVMFFIWMFGATSGGILLFMGFLMILAGKIPAGVFGLEIAVFSEFLMVSLAYLLAFGVGLWFYWGTKIYALWVARGGGITVRIGTGREQYAST